MPRRVAVVGRRPAEKRALERSLGELGFEVVDESSASPRVFVFDVSGYSPDEELRDAVGGFAVIPVLAVGAASDLPVLEQAVLAGAADFAILPSTEELALRLRRLVDSSPQAPRLSEPEGARRPSALIVEDDGDMRELLGLLLEDEYTLLTSTRAEDALPLARSEKPDVILLDVMLPGMDGVQCLEALRRDSRTAEIPVVLLSAQRSESARVRSIEAGAADYVAKPFLGKELVARVGKAIRDAEERRRLWTLARTDPLTGMANFRSLHERLQVEIERARRYQNPLAIIMLDLDNLKQINDESGHDEGNRAIEALAEVIEEGLRHTDFAARFGGDEFVVVLPHSGLEEGRQLAERLREKVHGLQVGAHPIRASFGVTALLEEEEADGDALIARADAALYEAKRLGRDRVCAQEGGA